ncbi:hypothetical protein IMZ48_36015 [Candidatus Bathyarchaeota archaeon]|nr:hypothetical protein [Candidatus Bathyarchaeota archaeon]
MLTRLLDSESAAVHVNQTLPTYFGVLDEVAKYNVQLNTAERLWAVRQHRSPPETEYLDANTGCLRRGTSGCRMTRSRRAS